MVFYNELSITDIAPRRFVQLLAASEKKLDIAYLVTRSVALQTVQCSTANMANRPRNLAYLFNVMSFKAQRSYIMRADVRLM